MEEPAFGGDIQYRSLGNENGPKAATVLTLSLYIFQSFCVSGHGKKRTYVNIIPFRAWRVTPPRETAALVSNEP